MTDLAPLLASTGTVIAVVGATDTPGKYGGIIYRDLKSRGYRVLAVNPKRGLVDGDHSYPRLVDLPSRPDIIDLVVPPAVGLQVVVEAVTLGYGNIWLQPGAESRELIAYLEKHDVPYLADACIMVSSRQLLRRPYPDSTP
jgi:predicted CoA-binding protein